MICVMLIKKQPLNNFSTQESSKRWC